MFSPPRWLRNPHAQTIAGALWRERRPPASWSHYVPSLYGDTLRVDVSPGLDPRPTVLLLHGIAGSSSSPQVVTAWRAIEKELGWRVAALNFRGADGRCSIPRLYHAGSSEDLTPVVAHLLQTFEGPLFVAGFSLGANVLLKWLGEHGGNLDPRVLGACAFSVPFQLGECADHLESTWLNRSYRERLIVVLKARTQNILRRFPGSLPLTAKQLARLTTLRQFDAEVTAPLHGFSGLEDYYEKCSSAAFLKNIKRPTLVVHAKDDPFYPVADPQPLQKAWSSPCLELEFTDHGGHLGYLGPSLQLWFEHRLVEYFKVRLSKTLAART